MTVKFSKKLKKGDTVRVVSPADSVAFFKDPYRSKATARLKSLGLEVTYGKNSEAITYFDSSTVAERVKDIHDAFADKQVRAILSAYGGFNSNQLLPFLDYDLIGKNPKILCGTSDITALQNAIFAKTGLCTYAGPHFSTWGGGEHDFAYISKYFENCLFDDHPFELKASASFSCDKWSTESPSYQPNPGYYVLNEGHAEGVILGGNLCTLNLLQGTPYFPKLNGAVLFLEDDNIVGPYFAKEFDRNLESLVQQSGFENVLGIVFGRFETNCNLSTETLAKIISSKPTLKRIPIISGLDFGHTFPLITFPIGGQVQLHASKERCEIQIKQH